MLLISEPSTGRSDDEDSDLVFDSFTLSAILAIGMSLLLLLVLSSPVLGLIGRLAEVRRPGLEGPAA